MLRNSLQHGRRLLLAGFGGLLTLMLAGGIDSMIRLHEVNRKEAGVRAMYLQRALPLEQIRAGIYQSSIVLRDYLLSGDSQSSKQLADRWAQIRRDTDQLIAQRTAAVEPEEAPLFQALQNEVQDYWKIRESMVLTPGGKQNNPYTSGDLVRRRVALLALIDRMR